jgi:hypothetical protein
MIIEVIKIDAIRLVAIFLNRAFVELVHKRSKQANARKNGDKS